MVKSDESRRFAGKLKTLEELREPTVLDFVADSRIRQLREKTLVGRTWLFGAVEKSGPGGRSPQVEMLTWNGRYGRLRGRSARRSCANSSKIGEPEGKLSVQGGFGSARFALPPYRLAQRKLRFCGATPIE